MKKRYFILLILMCIFLMPNVNAGYNGSSGNSGIAPGTGSCDPTWEKYCLWNTNNTRGLQITLYYYETNGSRKQIGEQIFVIADKQKFLGAGFTSDWLSGLIVDTKLKSGLYDKFNAKNIESYLMQDSVFEKYIETHVGVKISSLTLPSDEAPKYDGKGYRLVIEPMISVMRKGKVYLKTIKEIAEIGITRGETTTAGKQAWRDMSTMLYLAKADVGISAGNSNGSTDITQIRRIDTGWGYNVIDISNKIPEPTPTPEPTPDPTPTPPPTPLCDYSLNVSIPNNCTVSTSGYIKDVEDWKCIFQSTMPEQNLGDARIENHFYRWDNDYCAVYCREEITYGYPGNSMTVLAGTHFVLGDVQITNGPSNFTLQRLNPISFTSATECRITKAKNDSTDTNINYEKFKEDYEKANNNVKIAWDNWQSSKTSVNKSIYDQAVKKRDDILNDIKACNNFIMKNDYFNPEISFYYEEPVYERTINSLAGASDSDAITRYYNSSGTLVGTKKNENINFPTYTALDENNDFVVMDENTGNTSKVNYWDCNNTTCTSRQEEYPSNSFIRQYTEKTYKYALPNGIYQYVNKTRGESYDNKSQAGGDESVIYIPYSNLPVHFTTPAQDYDYELNIKTLGTIGLTQKHKFDYYIFNDEATKQSFGGSTKYVCTYNVENDFIQENPISGGIGDIDLIFRPISLDNPFPSIDADGREPGENWNKMDLYNNKVSVDTYITNNRGVETEEIYRELDPLYKITLTPALIKQIREYNKAKASETTEYLTPTGIERGIVGYTDFELNCDSNGRKCKSDFIRGTVSGYSFSNHFSGCGIQNKATGLRCSANDAW